MKKQLRYMLSFLIITLILFGQSYSMGDDSAEKGTDIGKEDSVSTSVPLEKIVQIKNRFEDTNTNVTSEDIVVAEPVLRVMDEKQDIFITVNILKSKLVSPIYMGISRKYDVLPFADSIKNYINVSPLMLVKKEESKTNSQEEISPALSMISQGEEMEPYFSIDKNDYSERGRDFEKEIKIINDYFDALNTKNEIKRSDAIKIENNSIEKSEKSKENTNVLAVDSELKELEKQYNRLFEEQFMVDKIENLSYFLNLGHLSKGNYVVRFMENDGKCIKKFSFEIVEDLESINH